MIHKVAFRIPPSEQESKTVIVEYAKKLPANTRDKLLRKIAKKNSYIKTLDDAFKQALDINRETSFVEAATGRYNEQNGTKIETQINELSDSFQEYEVNVMNTRSTNRSGDGSWNGSFDRSSNKNTSFNSPQNSRSNYRSTNYPNNSDGYNRQNYSRDSGRNRNYQQQQRYEQRNQNYSNRYDNNQDRNRFNNRRRPNKYQHHRNQHKAQVIFEFSDQNIMEMMQTVRGFINLIKANPTTREQYKSNKLATRKYDNEVSESEIQSSCLEQVQQFFNEDSDVIFNALVAADYIDEIECTDSICHQQAWLPEKYNPDDYFSEVAENVDIYNIDKLGPTTGTVFQIFANNNPNIKINTLFDTRAMKSIMSLEMYKKLKLKDLDTTSIPHVVGASGESLGARGRIKCEVNINGRIFYQTFIVCEHLKRPIILGRDFSIQNCIGISWTKTNTRQLTQNNEVIAETAEYQTPSRASVSLKRNIKVPPRSCAVVDVDINTTEKIEVEVIPDQLWLSANPNICTYPMIADLKERGPNTVTPFVIVNFSHHEHLYLPKDHVVAFAEKDCNKGEILEICTMEQLDRELPRNWIPERKRQEKFSEFFENLFMQKNDDFLKSPAEAPAHRKVLLEDKNISPKTQESFDKLCEKYDDIISKNSSDIGKTMLIEMEIDTGNHPPIASKPYTLPLKHYDWVQKEIETLERAGIIERSISPWASPVVIVPKKSAPGEPPRRRMCVDYHRINKLQPEVTKADSGKGCISLIPLPKIDELYAKLKGYKVFSSLDLRSGYYHIGLKDSAKPKSAFVLSSLGKYQFNRVPFGLAQAPAYFQKLINDVLKGCNFAMGYLDDIIIYSRSEKEHLEHLEEIFTRLKTAGLKLKLEKCCFFKKHIQ